MRILSKNGIPVNNGNLMSEEVKNTVIRDLEITKLAKLINKNENPNQYSFRLLDYMSFSNEDINYRQEVSSLLVNNELLFEDLNEIYISLLGLKEIYNATSAGSNRDIHNYLISAKWVSLYCNIIKNFVLLFKKHSNNKLPLAFRKIETYVNQIYGTEEFKVLEKNSQKINHERHTLNSITVGVNLDDYLNPITMNCLEINEFYYNPKKMLKLGSDNNGKNGIGTMIYMPRSNRPRGDYRYDERNNPTVLSNTNSFQRFFVCKINNQFIKGLNSFCKSLNFNSRLQIREFIIENSWELLEVIDDLGFYISGATFVRKLKDKGMAVCLPKVTDIENRIFRIEGMYNCLLPFTLINAKEQIVCNHIDIDSKNTFSIISGPNKGGKTTMLQAIAYCYILFQLGFYVPGEKAAMSPVSSILTHYQRDEGKDRMGRLEGEATNINRILSCIDKNSFIMFNEPFVSTTPSEGVHLVLNILSAFVELGYRGILVTHFHGIYDLLEENGIKVNQYNMGVEVDGDIGKRTYDLCCGPGEEISRAMDILKEYAPRLLDEEYLS